MARYGLLSDTFIDSHPEEAAGVLEGLPIEQTAAYLEATDAERSARVVGSMLAIGAAACLSHMEAERAAKIVEHLELDSAAAILRAVDATARERVLAVTDAAIAEPLARLLRYSEGTAGAFMDPRVKVVPAEITVAEAMARLRSGPGRVLYYLYVVDRDRRLVGVLNLRELTLAPAEETIGAIARREVARLSPTAARAAIVAHPRWRDVHALPVADESGRLLGAIRYGTFRRLEEELDNDSRRQHPITLGVSLFELYWQATARLLPLLVYALVGLLGARDPAEDRAR